MRVDELSGAELDYWVARAEGYEWAPDVTPAQARGVPPFSTDWSQGGPIIERERITLGAPGFMLSGKWEAFIGAEIRGGRRDVDLAGRFEAGGDTPLVAAMRCYVRSKFGDEVNPG